MSTFIHQDSSQLQPQLITPIPIAALSYADRPNHANKALWTHLKCKDASYVTFHSQDTHPPLFKIIYEGKLHSEISLGHLARLAELDSKSATLDNTNDARLNIIVKKPLFAIKYTTEAYETKRLQVKFLAPPHSGFDTVYEQFRRHGLTPKDLNRGIPSGQADSSRAVAPAQANIPTSNSPATNSMPLTISHTQDQRISAPQAAFQTNVPLSSLLLPALGHQIQQGDPSLKHVDDWQQEHIHTPARGPQTSFTLISKQDAARDGRLYSDTLAIGQLTDRPVERMLSYSTPPSSQHQPHFAFPEIINRPVRLGMNNQPFCTLTALSSLQPSPLDRTLGFSATPEKPSFPQDPGSSRNVATFPTGPGQPGDCFQSSGADLTVPLSSWRPATAPAYSGLPKYPQSLDSFDSRPPKRVLPFPSLQKVKKSRAEENQKEPHEDEVQFTEKTIATPQETKQRPATSPAVLTQAKKSRKTPQARKSAKPKVVAKEAAKQADEISTKNSTLPEPAKTKPKAKSTAAGKNVLDKTSTVTSNCEGEEASSEAMGRTLAPAATQLRQIPDPTSRDGSADEPTQREELDSRPSSDNESRRACEGCRKLRSKCDKLIPECTRCEKAGRACDYISTFEKERRASKTTAEVASSQPETEASPAKVLGPTYVSTGTQVTLVSFQLPSTRMQGVQVTPEAVVAFNPNQVAAINEIQEAINNIAIDSRHIRPFHAPSNKVADVTTKEQHEEALQQLICSLIVEDEFIEYCEQVQRVCERTGINVIQRS